MKLTIWGASDDLLEIKGDDGTREEFDVPFNGKGEVRILAPNGDALTVTAEFDARGPYTADWTLTVRNTGTWPAWPIHYTDRPDREGDPALIIDVPEGTIVKEVAR